MSDRKNYSVRLFAVILCCATVLMLAGCSAVFTSTITGQVVEDKAGELDPVGVNDVEVYAFLNESQRKAALDDYKNHQTLPKMNDAVYYAKTSTQNGEAGYYTISITWETASSAFGKTADRRPVYLAFYNKNFGFVAADETSYMTSDKVTRMRTQTLVRKNNEYTVALAVKNVAGAGSGTNMTALPTGMKVVVKDDEGNELYNAVPSNLSISFVYDKTKAPKVTFSLVLPGSTWLQTAADGKSITESAPLSLTDTNMSLGNNPLYLKNLYISEQTVAGTFTDGTGEERNGHTVWLVKKADGETAPTSASTSVADTSTYSLEPTADNPGYGYFEFDIGSWTATEDEYPDRYMNTEYWVVVSQNVGATKIESGDYYQLVTVTNNPSKQGFRNITISASASKIL